MNVCFPSVSIRIFGFCHLLLKCFSQFFVFLKINLLFWKVSNLFLFGISLFQSTTKINSLIQAIQCIKMSCNRQILVEQFEEEEKTHWSCLDTHSALNAPGCLSKKLRLGIVHLRSIEDLLTLHLIQVQKTAEFHGGYKAEACMCWYCSSHQGALRHIFHNPDRNQGNPSYMVYEMHRLCL